MPKPAKKPTKKTAKTTRGRKPDAYPYPGADVVSGMRRHRKVSIVLAVVVGLLLAWWGFNAIKTEVQFRQDKKQYAAAEASMGNVYDQMVATAGEPAESHVIKSCDHRSAKFETGDLYCEITYKFFYPVANSEQGALLVNSLKSSLGHMAKNQQIPTASSETLGSEKNQSYPFEYGKDMGCGLAYGLTDAEVHNIGLGDGSQDDEFKTATQEAYAAEFDFYCDSFPVKPVYELAK